MKHKTTTNLLAAVTLGFAAQANGATIVQFEFTGGTSSSSTEDPNITVSDPAPTGSGLDGINFTNNEIQVGGDQTNGAFKKSLSDAVAQDSYFDIKITADSQTTVNLDSISFLYGYVNSAGSAAGVFGSGDNFTTALYDSGTLNSGDTTTNQNIDLSGMAGYQNVTSDTIEFRFYMTDASGSDTRFHRWDDITVTGNTTVIPEPSIALLGGLGLLALLRRRR